VTSIEQRDAQSVLDGIDELLPKLRQRAQETEDLRRLPDATVSELQEIGFFREAARRSIEPVILYAADPHRVAVNAYAELRQRFRRALLVPVFNDAILKGTKVREDFPFSRAVEVPLHLSTLSPMLKAQIERSRHSFADVHGRLPLGIPIGLAFELHAWTRRTFLQFRELELRLLLETLRASLPGIRF